MGTLRNAVLLGGLCLLPALAMAADTLQPFILAGTSDGELPAEIDQARTALQAQQFDIIGEYAPYPGGHVIAVSHPALQELAAQSGSSGFAGAVHVGLTRVGDQVQVAYMNPDYMSAAYRLGPAPAMVGEKLAAALGAERGFGTEAGRKPEELAGYHYMIGMEYFTDPYQLASYKSTAAAVEAIDANLAKKVGGAALVYKLPIEGTQQVLYGISRADVEDQRANDKHILADTVDQQFDLKTTPYLPYQMLVDDGEVTALHMRFRMAVYHPDLTMGTFGKLISSPGAIEELLREVAGGEEKRRFSF